MLKWPNDVLLLGRKLAGILLERSGDRVAIGFGVNLASAPELPDRAGSVARWEDRSRRPSRLCLAGSFARLLGAVAAKRAALLRAGLAGPRASGRHAADGPCRSDETVSGRFDGIEADGALRLRRDDGSLEIVRAGDVEL